MRWLKTLSVPILMLVSCCAVSVPSSWAESYPLKRVELSTQPEDRGKDPDFLYRMVYSKNIANRYRGNMEQALKQSGFPEVVKKEPAPYKCENPLQGTIQLGETKVAFAFDSEDLYEKGYHLLYLDFNGNGDLTDDKVIEAEPLDSRRYGGGYKVRSYSKITLPMKIEGKPDYDYSFLIRANSQVNQQSKELTYANASVKTASYRSGDIELAGKKHKIVVLDFNSDGRFDSKAIISKYYRQGEKSQRVYIVNSDIILIDPDLNNRTAPTYTAIGRRERQPLTNLIQIDEKFYNIQLTSSGDELTLTPAKITTGFITNKNQNFTAMLYNDTTKDVIKVQDTGQNKAVVPAGKWKLAEYMILESPGSANQEASYVHAAADDAYPEVEVKTNQTAEMPFGPPFYSKVTVSRSSVNPSNKERQAYLSLDILGSMGESVQDMRIKGQRPEKPIFAIATPKGKLVDRGNFEYG